MELIINDLQNQLQNERENSLKQRRIHEEEIAKREQELKVLFFARLKLQYLP